MQVITSREIIIEIDENIDKFAKNSSRYEEDIIDLLYILSYKFKNWISINKEKFFQFFQTLFTIDFSTVNPKFEPISLSSIEAGLIEEFQPELELEYDVYLNMLPVREYNVKLKILSRKKGDPKILISNNDLIPNNDDF